MLQKIKIVGQKKVKIQDDEYLPDFKKLQLHMYRPCFKRVPQRKLPRKREKIHQIRKKKAVKLEILSNVLVVNANQRLLMQKTFAAWIKKKFLKIIAKV